MALFVFGDSYTEGYKEDLGFPPYKQYREYLGVKNSKQLPPIWSEILGEKLGTDSYNHGKGGASNHETFLRICEQSSKFKKDDIVIINWTYIERVLWFIDDGWLNDTDYRCHLTSVTPHQGEHYDPRGEYQPAYDIIAINRQSFAWTYEIVRYQQMIDTLSNLIGFKVYYWFTDDYLFNNFKKIENVNQEKYILNDLISTFKRSEKTKQYCCIPFNIVNQFGGTTLYDETNFVEDDMHLGGDGHRVQAELFYCYLTKTKYPNYNKTLI